MPAAVMPRRLRHLLISVCLLPLAACGGDDESSTSATSVCTDFDTPHQTFSAGMTAMGDQGMFQVKLLDAQPAPPARGDNSWTAQILDAAGAPLPGATVNRVHPYMPDHGHGTKVVPAVSALDAEAKCDVTSIDFRMAGVWTITFDVTTAAGTDSAVLAFCIDG
jgi:hypothetical protein